MGNLFLVVHFMDREKCEPSRYLEHMKEPAMMSVIPHIPLQIWHMAQIVIGSSLHYVAAKTSYMSDVDRMLHCVLPHCKVLDLLVKTTNRVYFSVLEVSIIVMW